MRGRGSYPKNPTFSCIAARPRREILLALRTWGPALSEPRLASYLAATSQRAQTPDTRSREAIRGRLVHVHLPMLEAAGLVAWDQDTSTVSTTTHPALDDPRFGRLLEINTDALNDVFAALSHDYRRIVLTILEGESEAMTRTELTRAVLRRMPETFRPPELETEALVEALHHVHLPKLDALGFIRYTPDTGHATYIGHPVLEEVFDIIHGTPESTTDKMGGFLDGMADSYRWTNREASDRFTWPHNWRHPHYG